ncbi:Arm DNA-binding domain-containing protein [Carnimonas bestiolae]|uniref:Arm DNA-binding domain-containing protein n=1 Tax=Carnimonas bestiolae TaxID=3402172 RepID=UPI003EDBF04C
MGDQFPEGVRPRSKTTIQIDFYYKNQRCRESIKLEPTPANLKKAARHRAAIISAIENGTFDYAVTFPKSAMAKKFIRQDRIDNYLRLWLEEKEPTIKSSTANDYRKIIEGHLIPAFGHLMLLELKRSHVREFASILRCSNKRIANILSVLRAALDDAMHDERIELNPIAGWHYRRQEEVKPGETLKDKPDPFTKDEQGAILAALPPAGRPLIQFAFWTGLRTSELVALEWRDIDLDRKRCRVERALTQAANGRVEMPKTAAGTRTIDLLPPAIEALQEQFQLSSTHESGRVFLNPRDGKPWTGDQALRKTLWTHALKKANVRYRRQYQTRHTYASMMVSAGEPLAWVSRQMGHSSVTITAQIYASWIPIEGEIVGSKAIDTFWK